MKNETRRSPKPAREPRLVVCELTDEDLVKVVGGALKRKSASSTVLCLRRTS